MADGDDNDDSQKTEDPTQRRLEEARRKGQVAVSREANNWLMLMTGAVLVASMSPSMMARLRDHLQIYIERAAQFPERLPVSIFTLRKVKSPSDRDRMPISRASWTSSIRTLPPTSRSSAILVWAIFTWAAPS